MTDDTGNEPFEVAQTPQPFAMVPTWMIGVATPGAIALYVALSQYVNGKTGKGAYPSISKLSEDLRVSRSTVKNWLGELREVDGVRIEQRFRTDGSQTSSLYRLRTPWATPPGQNSGHPPVQDSGHHEPNPLLTKAGPTGTAPTPPPAGGATLPGMPEPEFKPNAGQLVAAWAKGFTETHGAGPLAAVTARVGRVAKQMLHEVARDPASLETALSKCHELGKLGLHDLAAHWGKSSNTGSIAASTQSRNAAILARSMERAQQREE